MTQKLVTEWMGGDETAEEIGADRTTSDDKHELSDNSAMQSDHKMNNDAQKIIQDTGYYFILPTDNKPTDRNLEPVTTWMHDEIVEPTESFNRSNFPTNNSSVWTKDIPISDNISNGLGWLLIYTTLLVVSGLVIKYMPWMSGVIFIGMIFYLWNTAPERVAHREARKEAERITKERQEEANRAEKERRENECRISKEAEMQRYRQLRKEIEAMPQYRIWREEVLQKLGRKCIICGSTQNIEVDHRHNSFYSIVKLYEITNTVQAYECAALWDVDNGAPLCKEHHDQTKTSLYHRESNYK